MSAAAPIRPRRTHFRPCIDLHGGVVKQIVGASLRDRGKDAEAPVTNFVAAKGAEEFATLYAEDELKGGHVIMLGPGNEAAARSALATYPLGLQIGGGINAGNAADYIQAGASHVIVTSYVFCGGQVDFARLEELVRVVGKERLVLDLSCRQRPAAERGDDAAYYVVTDRWQTYTSFAVNAENLARLSEFCDEFLVHGVEVEGLRCGMLEDLIERLAEWSPIPVTYAGGARDLADLERVHELSGGKVDLTIGSALDIFGGELPYREVVRWSKQELSGAA